MTDTLAGLVPLLVATAVVLAVMFWPREREVKLDGFDSRTRSWKRWREALKAGER